MTSWVLGEFSEPQALLDAVKTLRGEHVRELDTHTPAPIPGLDEALANARGSVTPWALLGAALGTGNAWLLGAEPIAPALLGAAALLSAALLRAGKLPHLDHPLFQQPTFASSSSYWISVNTRVPEDAERAKSRLEALGAKNVTLFTEAT